MPTRTTRTTRTAPERERPTLTDPTADMSLGAATSPDEPTVPGGAAEAVQTAAPVAELPGDSPASEQASPVEPPANSDTDELATDPRWAT